MKAADYFEKKDDNAVLCLLCPHFCRISEGKTGICGPRKNIGGNLYTLNYGVVSGMSFDPIEKKPLYHYYPGSEILSVGTVGCNLHCQFCQNYHISRYFDEMNGEISPKTSPEELLKVLKESSRKGAFGGIAYTYSEPMVWYEFLMDTAGLMKKSGFKNILVTNGFINPEPLKKLLPLVDAANIDLKAFTEENYKRLGGKLKPVLDSITAFKEAGVHVELTTLVVTKFNDHSDEIENLVKWIAALDKTIPFHLSRYFPQYKYHEPPTDVGFMQEVKKTAEKYLDFVYLGNHNDGNNTYCPDCRNLWIERQGYFTKIVGLDNGKCRKCGKISNIEMV